MFAGERPQLDLNAITFSILLAGTVMKLGLFWYCNLFKGSSDTMAALAEDHINDVASNIGALLAAAVTKLWPAGWWVDGSAAILIALVILLRWGSITYSQVGRVRMDACVLCEGAAGRWNSMEEAKAGQQDAPRRLAPRLECPHPNRAKPSHPTCQPT